MSRHRTDMTTVFRRIVAALTIIVAAGAVQAADGGVTRFWNLTGETIIHLYLAPTGTTAWGADQCKNDPDGSVDFDERLRILGVLSGHYDVKFTDKTGRSCIAKNVEVKAGAVFSIDKETLAHCGTE
jgi:hypothetical protein